MVTFLILLGIFASGIKATVDADDDEVNIGGDGEGDRDDDGDLAFRLDSCSSVSVVVILGIWCEDFSGNESCTFKPDILITSLELFSSSSSMLILSNLASTFFGLLPSATTMLL